MKKIISIILILTIAFSNIAMAQSDITIQNDSNESPTSLITDMSRYEVQEIKFIPLNELLSQKKNTTMSDEQYMKHWNIKNINEIKNFIKDLNLQKYGQKDLEKHLLQGIKDLETESGYIDKYQFYIPKTSSKFTVSSLTQDQYYGTYNNREFRDYFDVYNDSYQRHSYDSNKHQEWAEGLINFSLIFLPKTINLGYFALSATNRDDIITFGTESIRHDGSDEVTRHYITIQDLYNTMGAGSDEFYVTIVDEARTNTTDSVIDFASPTKPTVTDNITYMEPVYCSTWSDSKSSQMQRGYNQFISDPGAPVYNLVGRFAIPW